MVFNPNISDQGLPNFTGRSQGTGPNRTFETLFNGLAETAQNYATIKDQRTQQAIRTEAEEMFDSVNEEFSLTPPSGMQNELDRIQSLQTALEQGKISEVNYYGRLATLSKQLRSKYPRYEPIVDATIQSVTGTRPANAFRDAIFSEMRSIAQSASDEERFRRQYEKENEGVLNMIYGDDYFTNPAGYDFEDVRSKVSRFKGNVETLDYEMKQLSLEAKRGELNDKKASRVMSQFLSFTTEAELGRALNVEGQNFQTYLSDFMASGGENLEEFTLQIGQIETNLRASLLAAGREKFLAQGLTTQDELNKAVDAAMFPVTEAKKAILGGDFEYAGRMAVINKNITDRALNDIYRAAPETVVGSGLSKINEAFGTEYLTRMVNTNQLDIDNLAKELTGRAMAGSDTEALKKIVEGGYQKESNATLDTMIDVIKQPEIQQEDLSRVLDQLVGPNALDFMSPDNVDPSDLETIYTKFLDPEITRAIVERGSADDLRKYTEWAVEKFSAIPAFRAVAGNVNNAMSGINPEDVELVYNSETNRLDLTVSDEVLRSEPGSFNVTKPLLRQFVGSMNKALAVLDPIAEANGMETSDLVGQVISDMNLNLEGASENGFWGRMVDWFNSSPDEVQEDMTPIGEEVLEETEIDYMFEAPEQFTEDFQTGSVSEPLEEKASGAFTGNLSEFQNEKSPSAIAAKFVGLHEKTHKNILSSFIKKAAGLNINPATTAWCAAFVNAALGATGIQGTGKLNARSFLDFGEPVEKATRGDVVVLSRGGKNSWKGHVGFYVKEDKDYVWVLGGNQSNRVSIDKYAKRRLLGYRRPPKLR